MFLTRLLNLDHFDYNETLGLMRGLVEIKRRSSLSEILILVEHEPVFTMGRGAEVSDILVSTEYLIKKEISVHRIERGGLITYHGPGQLVAYPIFNLHTMGFGVVQLVQRLEEVIIKTLSNFGIDGHRMKDKRGVWVKEEKIASIGIAVRGGISFHGLALNYDPDLSYFELVNPCGMREIRMTSMARILGKPVNISLLRETMANNFGLEFGLNLTEWSLSQARGCIEQTPAIQTGTGA